MQSPIEGYPERLKELIGPNSVRAFAVKVGIKSTTLQNQLNGAVPGIDSAAMIANETGVSLDWLIKGVGDKYPAADQMRPARQADERETSLHLAAEEHGSYALIPWLDVAASAGAGALAIDEQADGFLAFQAEWLVRRGINVAAARVLQAKGDSMEPTIRDGDALLVDTSVDRIIDHAIYVVIYGNMLLVKRVQQKLDGAFILSSDNKLFRDEVIEPNETKYVRVAGRVMWYGRSI